MHVPRTNFPCSYHGGFYTNERENFDITGQYVLSNGQENSTAGNPHSEQLDPSAGQSSVLGTGLFHQHARNTLQAGVVTLAHNGSWTLGNNTLVWGLSGQAEWGRNTRSARPERFPSGGEQSTAAEALYRKRAALKEKCDDFRTSDCRKMMGRSRACPRRRRDGC